MAVTTGNKQIHAHNNKITNYKKRKKNCEIFCKNCMGYCFLLVK